MVATIRGKVGPDVLRGTAQADTLFGLAGNDVLLGLGGSDRLVGGDGGDRLIGGAGDDRLEGGSGNDTLLGGADDDFLLGGTGDDVLDGGSGNDRLDGGAGRDTLRGGSGDDVLVYAADDALIDGGSGTDTLEVAGAGVALRAATLAHVRAVEVIDLRGSGANSVVVDAALVSGLSDSGTLRVRAGADDTVRANGWTVAGQSVIGGVTYDSFTAGGATLQLEVGARAIVNGVIPLASLDGTNGFRLDGVAASDQNGFSVSVAGDVNGDGFDDLIVGAPGANSNGSNSGSSYVVFGASSGFAATLDLADLDGTNGFRLDGVALNDQSGRSVSAAGDVNGDGFDDVIIGAFFADPNGYNRSGSSYVVFGASAGFAATFDLADLNGTNGFRLDGVAAGDYSGISVSAAGDINGDGFDDFIIGASRADPNGSNSGSSYVVFGAATGFAATFDLAVLDGANGFRVDGVAAGDRAGSSVSAAGDINGDGFDDLIAGAYFADPNGEADAGASYVVFGAAAGFGSALDLAALDGSNGFRLDGVAADDRSGYAVGAAGDVNGDGFDDFIIGASRADPNGSNSGSSYVVFGAATGFAATFDLAVLDGANGFRVDGVAAGDRAGSSVSAAGDVNGDGFDDVIIGAFFADPNGEADAGASYVVFGAAAGFGSALDLAALDGSNGFRLDGVAADDRSGYAVRAAGDIDGDGFDDLLIGAPSADPYGSLSGSSYVLFGGDFTGAVALQGGNGNDVLTGTAAAEILLGGRGDDVLDGRGGADVLKGAAGDDTLVWHSAARRIDGGSGFDTLRVTVGSANLVGARQLRSIEAVDLTGGMASTLVLDAAAVRRMTDTADVLQVTADSNDLVHLVGHWTLAAPAVAGFARYTLGATGVDVADGVEVLTAGALDLAALDGSTGFRLDGAADGDYTGRALAAAGDVNGDGFADILVGANGADPNGALSGASHVVFGKAGGFAATLSLAALDGTSGFRLDGVAAGDSSGTALGGAGDVNGDGRDDFVIGAPGSDQNGGLSGSTYVVFGRSDDVFSDLALSALDGANGFRLDGPAGVRSGWSVQATADVNGDGLADLVIGAPYAFPGRAYVVFGRSGAFPATLDLDTLDGQSGFVLVGAESNDGGGWSVSAGDINGDGLDDVVFGAPANDLNGTDYGSVFVLFGRTGGFDATFHLAELDGSNGFRLDGVAPFDATGGSVRVLGDFNGDGFDDLLISAYGADPNGDGSGSSYVVFGNADGFAASSSLAELDGSNGFRLDGSAAGDGAGYAVSAAGDVNGDGFDDLLVGAYAADGVGPDAGAAYLLFGRAGDFTASLDLGALDGTQGLRLAGVAAIDRLGSAVAAAGDVDGDGFDDILLGAPGVDAGGNDAGAAYLLFGRDFAGTVDFAGGDDHDTLTGTGADEVLVGGRGDDVLDGGGGADVLKGGVGNDVLVWRAGLRQADGDLGTDTLRVAGSGAVVDLTALPRGTLRGIEIIDLTGSGNNAVQLRRSDVLRVSDTRTLRIDGNAGDVVLAPDAPWTVAAGSPEIIGDQAYRRYTAGTATLLVDTDVSILRSTGSEAVTAATVIPSPPAAGAPSGAAGGRAITGTSANDRLTGTAAAETLRGLNGNDVLNGGRGHDRLDGGNGNDTLLGGAGNDLLIGGAGNDTLRGDTGNDRLFGGAGNDRLFGGSGNDSLRGDAGNDVLRGEAGNDHLDGGAGNDQLFGGAGNDVLLGGAGNDRLEGGSGNDRLDGGAGNDLLLGGTGSDVLLGGAGNDRLDGGAGRDFLLGGSGDDVLVYDAGDALIDGGSGTDTLEIAGAGAALWAATLAHVHAVEVIDLRGDGANSLVVDAALVSTLSETDTLRVRAGADDRVRANGWTAVGQSEIAGVTYETYTAGAATLQVEVGAGAIVNGVIALASLDGANGFRLDGAAADDRSGVSVSAAGDVNGDGFADLLIGASGADPNGDRSGSSYVVFGQAGGFAASFALADLDGTNGLRLDGVAALDSSASAVSAAGDVNGDGFDDLLIGALFADPDGNSAAGSSYVVFGAGSGFPAVLDLAALDGTTGFRLDGIAAGDNSGAALGSAGDVNGDGFDDLIIGAEGADPNGSQSGSSYVVFGRAGGFAATLALSALDGTNGFRLDGADESDFAGLSVSAAGDVNGDGYDDLLVGAPFADPNGSQSGSSYVVFGRAGGFAATLDLASLDGANGFRLDGVAEFDSSGFSVSAAGDVNGDGFDDLLIGAYGAEPVGSLSGSSYVVFGRADGFGAAFALADLDGSNGFRLDGVAAGDESGGAVSAAGDVNGDGYDDLLVGAGRADPNGETSGSTYVVFGRAGAFTATTSLADLDGTQGLRLDGVAALDRSGHAVSAAGDVDGDGFDDILVGASRADPNGDDSGSSYVVFGADFTGTVDRLGGDGNDVLIGTAAAEVLVGGRGDDVLDGRGGGDALTGGAGDDTLVWHGAARRLDGGSGFDTLRVTAGGANLIGAGHLRSIEAVDMSGGTANTLMLDAVAVRRMTDTPNVLRVNGDTDDLVHLVGDWTLNGLGVEYTRFTHAGAEVEIASGVRLQVSGVQALAALDGSNGFRLEGAAAFHGSGFAVSAAGDVNGDGFDDVLVGAHLATPNGPQSGSSYVVFGASGGFAATSSLAALDGTNGFRLDGVAALDRSGYAVSAAGDINGDGYDDLLIGAYGSDVNGAQSGSSYVVFGKADTFAASLDLASLDGNNGFRLDGAAAGDFSGFALSAAGDVNGDGFDDLFVGAVGADPNGNDAGSSYVVFGKGSVFDAMLNLAALDGANGFRIDGVAVYDLSGRALSGAGDVNGDGFDDLIIGAFNAYPNGLLSGASYVVFGRASGFDATVSLAALDGTNGFRLDGVATGDRSGYAVSTAGDINGDGFADLLVSADQAAPNGVYSGSSYVVFGKANGFGATLDLASLDGSNGFRLDGGFDNARSGTAVSAAGDFNGDGYDDLLIGAPGADPAGASYLVFGKAGGFDATMNLATLDGINGLRFDGVGPEDRSGRAVGTAGDVNGDGFDDLLIGAAYADDNGSDAGSSYVVFGRDITGTVDFLGGDGNDTLAGSGTAEVLIGGRGDDVIDGGGGADVVKGGSGDDVVTWRPGMRLADGGSGSDTLRLDGSDVFIDFTQLPRGTVRGIEIIDLTGSGDNGVKLALADVLQLGDTNTLRIDGDAGDVVSAAEGGWMATPGGPLRIGEHDYQAYTLSAATLLIDTDITVLMS